MKKKIKLKKIEILDIVSSVCVTMSFMFLFLTAIVLYNYNIHQINNFNGICWMLFIIIGSIKLGYITLNKRG